MISNRTINESQTNTNRTSSKKSLSLNPCKIAAGLHLQSNILSNSSMTFADNNSHNIDANVIVGY